MPATRLLRLPGSCNLRDFGGYATADGRRVPRGRLLRSGLLDGLAPEAVAALEALPLRAVCDLRRVEERRLRPNPAFDSAVRLHAWEATAETSPIRDPRFAGSGSLAEARVAMVEMYRRIPFVLQPRLAGVFGALAETDTGATLVHCSAGKDRTGVAVALVLESLGVPRATVLADYALTNDAVDLRAQLLDRRAPGLGLAATRDPLLALSAPALEAVLDAHPDYLRAALEAIEARHGSLERYLLDELALAPALLAHLRSTLLEQPCPEAA